MSVYYQCFVCKVNGSVKVEGDRHECLACTFVHEGADSFEEEVNEELLQLNKVGNCK